MYCNVFLVFFGCWFLCWLLFLLFCFFLWICVLSISMRNNRVGVMIIWLFFLILLFVKLMLSWKLNVSRYYKILILFLKKIRRLLKCVRLFLVSSFSNNWSKFRVFGNFGMFCVDYRCIWILVWFFLIIFINVVLFIWGMFRWILVRIRCWWLFGEIFLRNRCWKICYKYLWLL